jgi:hypothetical protein
MPHLIANIALITVTVGVTFQVVTLARLGCGIARRRLTGYSRLNLATKSLLPAQAQRVARRRRRDYGAALASGKA